MADNRYVILVVEDDPDLRAALVSFLEMEDYDVATARNGREALDYLRANPPPRLVLLDLMMPVMNGWEFLAEKEADTLLAKIPVVVITASGEDEMSKLSPRPVLAKPLVIRELLAAVKRYC